MSPEVLGNWREFRKLRATETVLSIGMDYSPRSSAFEAIVRSTFPDLASMSGPEVNEANFVNHVCELLRLGLADEAQPSEVAGSQETD